MEEPRKRGKRNRLLLSFTGETDRREKGGCHPLNSREKGVVGGGREVWVVGFV